MADGRYKIFITLVFHTLIIAEFFKKKSRLQLNGYQTWGGGMKNDCFSYLTFCISALGEKSLTTLPKYPPNGVWWVKGLSY